MSKQTYPPISLLVLTAINTNTTTFCYQIYMHIKLISNRKLFAFCHTQMKMQNAFIFFLNKHFLILYYGRHFLFFVLFVGLIISSLVLLLSIFIHKRFLKFHPLSSIIFWFTFNNNHQPGQKELPVLPKEKQATTSKGVAPLYALVLIVLLLFQVSDITVVLY